MSSYSIPDFKDVDRSLAIDVAGKSWVFPTRRDYLNYLLNRGYLKSDADLYGKPDLIVAIQNHWFRRGQTGCKFAQALAAKPHDAKWSFRLVINDHEEDLIRQDLENVHRYVQGAIQNKDIEVLSLIFPRIVSEVGLMHLLETLSKLKGWSVFDVEGLSQIAERPDSSYVAVRVSLNEALVLSWIVGFGPFEFIARTRQSPFTELAIRVKPDIPDEPFPELNVDPSIAHLANIPIELSKETYSRFWYNTLELANSILDIPNDPAAKARVTYAVPKTAWESRPTGDP
jgi:hypothetical protein